MLGLKKNNFLCEHNRPCTPKLGMLYGNLGKQRRAENSPPHKTYNKDKKRKNYGKK